ncbi:MAG: hypothetical protein SFY81_02550 [Verrucomicrobiota bacterium]|nr:hypothetical protein [Verrucomicrobiota bacterium]
MGKTKDAEAVEYWNKRHHRAPIPRGKPFTGENAAGAFFKRACDELSDKLFNIPFAQQYLKGALESVDNGRKAVQEKVKFILPTALGTFATTSAILYVGLDKFNGSKYEAIFWSLSAFSSIFGIIVATALHRVLVATYDFYVSSVMHVAVIFKALKMDHHWTYYVERAIKRADSSEFNELDAKEIRQRWHSLKNQGIWWFINLFLKNPFVYREHVFWDKEETKESDRESNRWTSRVLETWKAQPGTLLDSYNRILGMVALGHVLVLALSLYSAVNAFRENQNADSTRLGIATMQDVELKEFSTNFSSHFDATFTKEFTARTLQNFKTFILNDLSNNVPTNSTLYIPATAERLTNALAISLNADLQNLLTNTLKTNLVYNLVSNTPSYLSLRDSLANLSTNLDVLDKEVRQIQQKVDSFK